MKYTVDEIIDNIVTLIDIKNGNKRYENISLMPDYIKENDIVILENDKYKYVNDNEKIQRIKDKMMMLKNIE